MPATITPNTTPELAALTVRDDDGATAADTQTDVEDEATAVDEDAATAPTIVKD